MLAAITAQGAAADGLTLACRQTLAAVVDILPPGVLPFRRTFKPATNTPGDMLALLGKLK